MPISTSAVEISESALFKNLQFIKGIIGNECTLSSVVKGNAYGHGIKEFVPIAHKCGIKHFSVFSAEEAYNVQQVTNGKSEVMIMGMIDPADLEWAISNEVSFFVFDTERLETTLKISKKLKKQAIIHLELETGLNRTGFDKKSLLKTSAFLVANQEHILVKGICTHYAGAESIANHVRVQKQLRSFNSLSNWLNKHGITAELKHTACSAAAMTYPKTHMDLVRIGIMQYGYWPSKETLISHLSKKNNKTDPIERVITWKSKIMTIKTVKIGEFIGYGTSYMAENDMQIGIIPVGYAQGYSRSLSNQGRILINGHRASIVGMVNMNMLIADITNIPGTKHGDEVVLIGNQGDMSISVSSFSELTDQLNYELLTRLPRDIPRIVTP